MSELVVGSLKGLSANSFVIDVATGSTLDLSAGAVFPAGSIIQVVQTAKTDIFSTTSTTFADVTGLSATITPRSSASKIIVSGTIAWNPRADATSRFRILRGSTAIGIGDAAGTRDRAYGSFIGTAGNNTPTTVLSFNFLDSPNTVNATTYKIQVAISTGTLSLNTTGLDTDTLAVARTISTITLMEVAG